MKHRTLRLPARPPRAVFVSVLCLCLCAALTPGAPAAADTVLDLASRTAWTFLPDGSKEPARALPVPAAGWRLNGFPEETAGVYRRKIVVPRLDASQTTVLDFEAVNWEAVVSVGPDAAHLARVAEHLSAWTPFRVDISKFVTPGAPALIQVHVRDRSYFQNAQGRFTVPAGPEWTDREARGIIRGVTLRVMPAVHIDNIFVKPATSSRTLTYTVTVSNGCPQKAGVRLSGKLAAAPFTLAGAAWHGDPAAKYPAIPDVSISLSPGETRTVEVGPIHWGLPASSYWHPNIPFNPAYRAPLHRLTVTASAGSVHTSSVRFGFCSMGQKGGRYTLNGSPINLRGDSLPEGTIGTDAFARLPGFLPPAAKSPGWPGAVLNYQQLNYNVIRMHQVPCTPYMMDVCDELGMLVIPETAIRGGGIAPEDVTALPGAFTTHLRELVLRDRNHPSVVKWSLENELPAVPEPFLRALYDVCMQADGTRPCSIDVFDKEPAPNWPLFAVIDHYSQPAGTLDAAGGLERGDRPKGEGEYVWPVGNRPQGPIWFALETRSMRAHNNSDLRPYTLIDVWPGVIPGLSPTNFPDPHLLPDSLEQGGRSLLNPANPWSDTRLQLIQRSFAPVAAFDTEYDDANMHTNGKGDWPTSVPTLEGGTTSVRKMVLFNDDLAGDDIKLIILPSLRVNETNRQPLPERTVSLRIPPGSHAETSIELAAPPVSLCTTLDEMVTVWKGGVERYREVLTYVVNPSGRSRATVQYAGLDTSTGGNWVDEHGERKYGMQAFMVPIRGGRSLYQDASVTLRRAAELVPGDAAVADLQNDSSDAEVSWLAAEKTDDERVPWSSPGRLARQPVAFCGNELKFYFRVDCADTAVHQLSIYLLDYRREALPMDIDFYDSQLHRVDSRSIPADERARGVYVKYLITGAVYVSIQTLSNNNLSASGLFVDPVP